MRFLVGNVLGVVGDHFTGVVIGCLGSSAHLIGSSHEVGLQLQAFPDILKAWQQTLDLGDPGGN